MKLPEKNLKVAISGNPNVGKSTFFNALTGMRQHTGNWPGKTVESAVGYFKCKSASFEVIDLPGTYSLMSHSDEEEVARDCICFDALDGVAVICDSTVLERNLILVLQILEIRADAVIALNLMDEAKKKNITIDIEKLSATLGTSVIPCTARSKKGLDEFVCALFEETTKKTPKRIIIDYGNAIESALIPLEKYVSRKLRHDINARFIALKLLENDYTMNKTIANRTGLLFDAELKSVLDSANNILIENNIDSDTFKELVTSTIVKRAEEIAKTCSCTPINRKNERDRKLDKILTDKKTGIPIMLLLLLFILFLTLTGANYFSGILSDGLFFIEDRLYDLLVSINAPEWLTGILILGLVRTLFWVISVMLPPMAIFFPLFTLLEDFGYLPRVAFNLDMFFKRCSACGKQALSMCMGLGCNAAGVIGCRIIDSPREKLIAIITNNFMPCNGRFPAYITIISIFFVGAAAGMLSSLLSAMFLALIIIIGIFATFLVSFLLSKTLLKGVPSSFTLELPPYRAPEIGKVIVRSIFDRTLFVLGRAVIVAAPIGIVIWLMANITVDGGNLISIVAKFLDPVGKFIGLDGVILLAFILAFPANEIVIPIVIMSYIQSSTMLELGSIYEMKALFLSFGWTWKTAVCFILFSLLHFPCSTTLLTIKKETGSLKWTLAAFLIPTALGVFTCALVAHIL
ncbi:MAG: ferrous iron transport protein B [Clostridia bacterium]